MSQTYDPQSHFTRFPLPGQDLTQLTFCGGNKVAHLQRWIDQLHVTRITQTSVQLYKNLPEISRLQTDPKTRLEMLELLRPVVQNCIAGLAKEFLGQPLILPAGAQKAAIVAQAIQKTMIDGYSTCVRELVNQRSLNSQARTTLATAIHRAIVGIGLLYLRSCQIYTQIPKGFWLHLHQLFRAAEHFRLSDTQVPDGMLKHGRANSIRHSYLRIIMLACSRSNQLSQQDLSAAFNAFELWAQHVETHEDVDQLNDNQFVINFSRDDPPGYKRRLVYDKDDYLLELGFGQLITALEWQKADGDTKKSDFVTVPMPPGLISHLIDTWGETVDRRQHRQSVKKVVDVCVGLIECHYHLSGRKNFATFMKEAERGSGGRTRLLTGTAGRFDGERPAYPTSDSSYTPVTVAVTNISVGGYCLYWQDSIPGNVTAGQLLGIRDAGQRQWHLGVVRWIRQLKGASQMGVQILALEAEPVATAICYSRRGSSDFMRALHVAPPPFDQTAATLITAAVPFQEFTKVRLKSADQSLNLELDQCIFSTSAIRQFEFHVIDSDLVDDLDDGVDDDMDLFAKSPADAEMDAGSDPGASEPIIPSEAEEPEDNPTLFDTDRDWD